MNNLITQIPDLLEKFKSFSDDYSEFKEVIFDDYNFELAEDSVKVLKFLNNGRKFFGMLKFKHFIKGLNLDADQDDMQKLIDYVDSSEKAEFITSIFEKILSANSNLACCIMGLILNDLCINKNNVSQSELVIIQALSVMNDFDILNFTYLLSISPWGKTKNNNDKKYKVITNSDKQGCSNKFNISLSNLDLTIHLLEKNGLIESDGEIDLSLDSDTPDFSSADYDKYYQFNLLSQKLYQYTSKIITI